MGNENPSICLVQMGDGPLWGASWKTFGGWEFEVILWTEPAGEDLYRYVTRLAGFNGTWHIYEEGEDGP